MAIGNIQNFFQGGRQPSAPIVFTVVEFDMDNSYTTGGLSLDLAAKVKSFGGYDKEPALGFVSFEQHASGYVFQFDRTAKKVKAYYSDDNGAADSPLIEVANATDLSAVLDVKALCVTQ